jgi:hypothetical protein
VLFFKTFWDHTKPNRAITSGFSLGRVDEARLNFGILTLIPKVQGRMKSAILDQFPLSTLSSNSLLRLLRNWTLKKHMTT